MPMWQEKPQRALQLFLPHCQRPASMMHNSKVFIVNQSPPHEMTCHSTAAPRVAYEYGLSESFLDLEMTSMEHEKWISGRSPTK